MRGKQKKITEKQINAITALPGPKRYNHFIKVVVDWEMIWGLWENGWALASADDGKIVLPFWPAKEYATLCANGQWKAYEPKSISLKEFINVFLPKLQHDDVLPGIFYTKEDKGVILSIEQLLNDLKQECLRYE